MVSIVKKPIKLLTIIVLTAAAPTAHADSLWPSQGLIGVRTLSLGGSATAQPDDDTAIFDNPAGIGRVAGENPKRLLRGANFPALVVGINPQSRELFSIYRGSDEDKVKLIQKHVNSQEATTFGRLGAFPNFTLGRFQFGLISEQYVSIYSHKLPQSQTSKFSTEAEPKSYDRILSVRGVSQNGAALGFSFPYLTKGLSLGIAGRALSLKLVDQSVEAGESVALQSSRDLLNSAKSYQGFAVDVGAIYVIPKSWRPTVAVTLKNAGTAPYTSNQAGQENFREYSIVQLGAGIQPPLGSYAGWVISGEYVDFDEHHEKLSEKFRAGTEIRIGSSDVDAPVSLRLGYSGTAMSYGVGCNLILMRLDVVSYGTRVYGENLQEFRNERRYLARLSVDLRDN